MESRYKKLVAYQRAVAFADGLHRHVRRWPELDRRTMGEQLMGAADSVGANIAEAAGRWSKAERRRFLITARGSLYEVEYWVDRARARNLSLPRETDGLLEAARALSGLISKHS